MCGGVADGQPLCELADCGRCAALTLTGGSGWERSDRSRHGPCSIGSSASSRRGSSAVGQAVRRCGGPCAWHDVCRSREAPASMCSAFSGKGVEHRLLGRVGVALPDGGGVGVDGSGEGWPGPRDWCGPGQLWWLGGKGASSARAGGGPRRRGCRGLRGRRGRWWWSTLARRRLRRCRVRVRAQQGWP